MSILIRGMGIPTGNNAVSIIIFPNGKVSLAHDHRFAEYAEAIPVPPHGDLVDRDEIFVEFVIEGQKSTRYKVGENWELNGEEIRRAIKRLPAIIPAEEGE